MRNIVLTTASALVPALLCAQEFCCSFSRRVTDPQGPAIVKAKAVATETRTGDKSETLSEATSEYTIPFLGPGVYQIRVEATGLQESWAAAVEPGHRCDPIVDIRPRGWRGDN